MYNTFVYNNLSQKPLRFLETIIAAPEAERRGHQVEQGDTSPLNFSSKKN
jgi:hypothetical protein